ncbi:MAG: four-helix bundle copper-binding protein [Desulfobacteraceae bacterium]|nr:MAG: four-helix bundle copper-binding protein [Desulfobacteraceae bacterium]
MQTTLNMLKTHPGQTWTDPERLAGAIAELYSCAQACTTCADACLGEKEVQPLVACIRTNLDCADICLATGAMLSRVTSSPTELLRSMLGACAKACNTCAAECSKHSSMHEHCRVCADVCRRCEKSCRDLLG